MTDVKKSIAAVIASVVLVPAALAAHFYVDAVNGNDDWDGSCTYENRDELAKKGPKQTIQEMMTGRASGDVIHAARGCYDQGEKFVTNFGSNRVVVVAGVKLVADEGPFVTSIVGKKSNTSSGIGDDSMRAVYLYSGSILDGFTVSNGFHSASVTGYNNLAGDGVFGAGLCVNCRFVGNGGTRGTAAGNGPTLLRCYVGSNTSSDNSAVYLSVTLIDCVYDCPLPIYSLCTLYNTLVLQGQCKGNGTSYPNKAYNSVLMGGSNVTYTKLYSSVGTVGIGTSSTDEDNNCSFGLSATKLPYDAATYRPLAGSAAINAGKSEYYALATNGWTAAWRSYITGTDYSDGRRKIGTEIDAGAGEYDWRDQPASGDVEVAVVDDEVQVRRTFLSEKLVTGFTFGGETYSFGGNPSNYVATVQFEGNWYDYDFDAVYHTGTITDWYVSPTGDDLDRGYSAGCPLRTFAAAMAKAASGHTVHAAAGVYDYGVMAPVLDGVTSNRLAIAAGRRVVADEGPERTFIVGRRSTLEGNHSGCASDAIRCVGCANNTTSVIEGFTLTGGATAYDSSSSSVYSYSGGGMVGGVAVGCVISNNVCGYRGGGAGDTTLVRCKVFDNQALDGVGASHFGSCYGCVFNQTASAWGSKIVNCTFLAGRVDTSANPLVCNTVFCSNINCDRGTYSNCVLRGYLGSNAVNAGNTTKTGATTDEVAVDPVTYRPLFSSALVDAGDLSAYESYVPEAYRQFDVSGGQRVYNDGKIDIGAGEYDWRGNYAAKLNRRAVVESASPEVTLADGGVSVPDGATLEFYFYLPKIGGDCSFRVSGEATVTATSNGVTETLSPVGGVYTLPNVPVQAESALVSVAAGTGGAVVYGVKVPQEGMTILFR